jgi:hypothetical protein
MDSQPSTRPAGRAAILLGCSVFFFIVTGGLYLYAESLTRSSSGPTRDAVAAELMGVGILTMATAVVAVVLFLMGLAAAWSNRRRS